MSQQTMALDAYFNLWPRAEASVGKRSPERLFGLLLWNGATGEEPTARAGLHYQSNASLQPLPSEALRERLEAHYRDKCVDPNHRKLPRQLGTTDPQPCEFSHCWMYEADGEAFLAADRLMQAIANRLALMSLTRLQLAVIGRDIGQRFVLEVLPDDHAPHDLRYLLHTDDVRSARASWNDGELGHVYATGNNVEQLLGSLTGRVSADIAAEAWSARKAALIAAFAQMFGSDARVTRIDPGWHHEYWMVADGRGRQFIVEASDEPGAMGQALASLWLCELRLGCKGRPGHPGDCAAIDDRTSRKWQIEDAKQLTPA